MSSLCKNNAKPEILPYFLYEIVTPHRLIAPPLSPILNRTNIGVI